MQKKGVVPARLSSLRAATALLVKQITLLHVRHIRTIFAAIVLTLGTEKPTTIALMITGSTLHRLNTLQNIRAGAAGDTRRQRCQQKDGKTFHDCN